MTLPIYALSIRQPWAWAIIHAGKDIENRSWNAATPGISFRGEFCVHAAQGMTRYEYEDARDFMASIGINCPEPYELQFGGIIGTATVVDIVKNSESRWFFGPKGLVLSNRQPHDFIRVGGALGFFRWTQYHGEPVNLAKWMLPANRGVEAKEYRQENLL